MNHHKGTCPPCGGFGALRGVGQAAPELVDIDLVAAAQVAGSNKSLIVDIDVMSAIAIVFGVVGHNHVAVAVKRLDQPILGIIDRAFLLHHRRIANRADERPLALRIAAHRE